MIKAFLKEDTLQNLYEKLESYHDSLETLKKEKELSYQDNLVYEVTCFALPLLDDYFSDNLYSMANYLRYRSIIESCTLLSLNAESDFNKINANLLEPQYNILKYRTYNEIKPNYVNKVELQKKDEIAKELIESAIAKDSYYSNKLSIDKVVSQKFPILLGRDLLESIRFYLGYIYENIYVKSGEMIHLIDYKDLNDKYSLTFFNDVTRMLVGMINQYDWHYGIYKKEHLVKDAKQIKKVYLNESFVIKSAISKIETKYGKCFISQAFFQLTLLEKSMSNSLLKGRYYDLNTLFKIIVEWIVNVDSLTDSISHLINFNFDTEIAKLGKEEREFKFVSMKRHLITPNLTWQYKSLGEIVDEFIDSTKKTVKKYYGLSNCDFLKMKYKESQTCSHGNGFLALADDRYFEVDIELLLSINDLLKETIVKITKTFATDLDLMVEEQIMVGALDQKYTLLMNLK